jgi:hypothetical protein
MKGTIITNFFNFKRKYKIKTKTYHFDKSRYELILLKQLEDNKIFYNGTIYESDFLYYHKLETFVKKIYALRDEYILRHFQLLSRRELKRLKKFSKKYNFINQEWIPYSKPYKVFKTVDDILKEGNTFNAYQINILINAFRYTFHYSLDYDLLDPYTRRRPIYKIDPKYDLIDPDVRIRDIEKNEVKPYKYLMVHPSFYQSHKNPLLINTFFEDWFYIIGWRSIKRVHPTFELQTYSHYTDSLKRKSFAKLHEKERVEPVFQSSIFSLQQGTTIRDEWIIEYDEQKKFDEYDINCKTNSYYTRYKKYNEFYNVDYPENKKFKTTLIHDFTEDELKENYANMIDKTKLAKEKWEYVITDSKYKNAVFDFFTRLEQHQISRRRYEYPSRWYLDAEEESNDMLEDEIEEELFQLLNDPQYLLVMPLVDAYFEIFRSKGWFLEDQSFVLYYPTERKIFKHLEFFDMSHERQYLFMEKRWLIEDYLELSWDEYVEDHMDDEYESLFLVIGLFCWLACINLYFVIILNGLINLPLNIQRINETLATSYEYYFNKGARSYYGIELKRARMRFHSYKRPFRIRRVFKKVRRWFATYYFTNRPRVQRRRRVRLIHKIFKLPSLLYKDGNYTFYKQRTWADNAFHFLYRITNEINDYEKYVKRAERKLRFIGRDYQLYRFRIIWVEEPMPPELQLFWPKIKKFWHTIVGAILQILKDIEMKIRIMRMQQEHPHISYMKYQVYYRGPIKVPTRGLLAHEEMMLQYRRRMTAETRLKRRLHHQALVDHIWFRNKKRTDRIVTTLKNRQIKLLCDRELKSYYKRSLSFGKTMFQWRRTRARKYILKILIEKGIDEQFARKMIYDHIRKPMTPIRRQVLLDEVEEIRLDARFMRKTGLSRRDLEPRGYRYRGKSRFWYRGKRR